MNYEECKACIAKAALKSVFAGIDDCSVQFNIIGSDSGCFYLDINGGGARVRDGEEGEAYKVKYIFTSAALTKIMNRILDPIYAYTTGKFKMLGDVALGRQVLQILTEK